MSARGCFKRQTSRKQYTVTLNKLVDSAGGAVCIITPTFIAHQGHHSTEDSIIRVEEAITPFSL